MLDKYYTVYVHIFPNKKRYVGMTGIKAEYRWSNGKGYKTQELVCKAIEKYKWHNIKHIILYTNLNRIEAENKEIELIKEWKTNDKRYGYNIESGGKCNVVSESTRRKISLSKIGKPSPNKGKSFSLETKKKISLSRIGDKNGMYGKIAANAKKIKQYDGERLIKVWNSTLEVERLGIANHSGITRCCKKTQNLSGGYRWEYAK